MDWSKFFGLNYLIYEGNCGRIYLNGEFYGSLKIGMGIC